MRGTSNKTNIDTLDQLEFYFGFSEMDLLGGKGSRFNPING